MATGYKDFSANNGAIRVNYSYTQSATGNYTDVTITSIQFYSTNWYATWFYADGTVTINGNAVTYSNAGNVDGCYISAQNTPATLGSKTWPSFRINHNASGAGSFNISLSARSGSGYSQFNVFCSASTNGNFATTGSQTVTLPTIDRTAPTVSLSASAVSTSSISISGSANVNCDIWQYSVDSGSWTNFSTTNGTTASGTITGLTAGNHTVQIRARKNTNYVYGSSSSVTVDTSAPTVTVSVTNIGSSGFKITASSNVSCNIWDYSLDNGSTWTRMSTTAGTSASIDVTGLEPNTDYNVRVRARKASNNIYGTSSNTAVTTLGGSILHSVANVTMDDASPAASFVATVYGSFYHSFRIYDEDGTTLLRTLTFTPSQLPAGSQTTVSFTYPSATRSSLLAHFPNTKTCVFKVVLETYSDSARTTLVGASGPQSFTASTTAANSSPTFTDFTYLDTESAVTAITQNNQILLQSYSHLKVTASAGTALNGSSITGYSVSIGDVSLSSTGTVLDVGSVSSSGSLTLKVTCSDSRGYSTTVEKTVTVLPYTNPRFTQFTLRCRNEIDSLVQLSIYGMVSSVKPDSAELNSIVQVKFKYKQTSDTTYTTVDITSAITINGLTFSYVNAELMVLDETNSFDFVFYVYDAFGDLTVLEYEYVLNQGTPLLAFRKRSASNNRPRVGVNNPTPYYELDVHGDIAMHDVLVLGFVAELTTEYLNNLKDGGYYTQSDASEAVTTRNYPVAKAGLLEILANGSGTVIQRYFPFDMTAAYARCYDSTASTPNWTGWKTISMS